MRGSVAKRGTPKPRYYVRVGDRWLTDPTTGRAFTRRTDAQAHLREVMQSMRTGTWVKPTGLTVAGHTQRWLTLARGRLKPSTWASYDSKLRTHLLPALGAVHLQDLTAGMLDELYLALLDRLAPRTVAYLHTIVKAVLADAVRKGLLTDNPACAATPPAPGPRPAHTTWTATQLADFLHQTRHHRYGALWAFLALTGCRRGEALGLRWDDIDDTTRRVVLTHTIGTIAGQVTTGTPKSGRGRTVAIDPGLLEQLHAHRAAQTRQRMAAPAWAEHGIVFTRRDGRPHNPDTISRAFKHAAAAAGLPPIRLHDLRHGWATLALQAGVNPKLVQERLGHANVTITLAVYSHVLPSMHDAAASTIATLISGQRPGTVLRLAD